MELIKEQVDMGNLPRHIAVIMDGNGRWAKTHGKERAFGHKEGVTSVRKLLEIASDLSISYLTLYTFSSENWNRPTEEVQALMSLLVSAIEFETPSLMERKVRLLAIGDLSKLPKEAFNTLNRCIEQTSNNEGLTLILALSYSSRGEIVRATKDISEKVMKGVLDINTISDETISEHLTTTGIPDPDLLIRTGGEQRISNFLLWQLSYTELYFTNKYWPEFRENEFYEAILYYQNRERRYGKISEQLNIK